MVKVNLQHAVVKEELVKVYFNQKRPLHIQDAFIAAWYSEVVKTWSCYNPWKQVKATGLF
jgi:hypothetical protein